MIILQEPLVTKSLRRYAFLYWLAGNYLLLSLLSRLGNRMPANAIARAKAMR